MKQSKKAKWLVGTVGAAFSAFVISQFSPTQTTGNQTTAQVQQHKRTTVQSGSNNDQSSSEWSFDSSQGSQNSSDNSFDSSQNSQSSDNNGFSSDRQTGRS